MQGLATFSSWLQIFAPQEAQAAYASLAADTWSLCNGGKQGHTEQQRGAAQEHVVEETDGSAQLLSL